jgi:hypothetical protein
MKTTNVFYADCNAFFAMLEKEEGITYKVKAFAEGTDDENNIVRFVRIKLYSIDNKKDEFMTLVMENGIGASKDSEFFAFHDEGSR